MRTGALPIFYFKHLYRYLLVLKTSVFSSFIVIFLGVLLVQVGSWFKLLVHFGNRTRYDLEILHLSGKRVKTKSQKYSGTNSNVYRSYRGKAGREALLSLHTE